MNPTIVVLLTIYACCIQQGFACMATDTPATTGPTGPTTIAQETSPVDTSTVVTTPLVSSPTTAAPDTTTTVTADNSKCVTIGPEPTDGSWKKGDFHKPDNLNIAPPEDDKSTTAQNPLVAQFDPWEKSTLAIVDVTPAAGQTAFVRRYEATNGLVLKGCRNDENDCENISNPDFNLEDRVFKTGILKLKEDTNKVILRAENNSPNIGTIAVSSVGIGKGSNSPCAP